MTQPFVHLHLHTEYSLIDSLVRIPPLVKALRQAKMPACAITDHCNLFGLIKFYRAALNAGIKPIVGIDTWIYDNPKAITRLVLLCQDNTGYRNLTRLVSQSYTEGQLQGKPYLRRAWLETLNEGLIALSGGWEGEIGHALLAGQSKEAEAALDYWQTLFPQRFYLQVQRTGKPAEEDYLHSAVELALAHDVPVVATNEVCFLDADDFEAHEVRVCIHGGHTLADERRPRRYSPQQYLRTPEEMAELFADLPEALENTWRIAQRCNVTLNFGENYLPDFPIPEGQTLTTYFRELAWQGLEQRFTYLAIHNDSERAVYRERLQRELDVIEQMGFPGYFLIVADFIQWAKNHNIPVGPGRGSGAGSLVAYTLGITDLDPLKYELLFERFLNPERVSMPDFDIDFCMEGRDAVINYVAERYGRTRVSQIITHGSLAAKAVVRDVGRVLGHPYGFVDKIAKLIPFELGITIEKALKDNAELRGRYQQEEEVKILIAMAIKLEGLTRNVGTHAGGVVIAPSELTDFTPLYCQEDGSDLVTQFDKDDIENIGLVKFDFLGLRTLTIIKWALQTIQRVTQQQIDIVNIPLNDAKTFDLLKKGDTTAVFQLESAGLKRLIKRLAPDCFEDLIALVALYRPGPLQSGMVDDFIARKHHRAEIEYPHPQLIPVLKPTYGVILYQEQVMKIAQVLSGYTLGGADLLRRAMGKKDAKEMAKQRDTFISGALSNNVSEDVSSHIFELINKFAGYGFNKTLIQSTKIRTASGIKPIENCRTGDHVFSMNVDGSVELSGVVALHDHGQVPLWQVEFADGTQEKCTLDHKWLTEVGQIPLWQILKTQRSILGKNTVSNDFLAKKPLRTTFFGWYQGYDLEVDHPQHNFLLASGLCCSNSHSAAYALIAYQTAWLKANYPAAFMAAVLSSDMDNTDKVMSFIADCRNVGLNVLSPNINLSNHEFTIKDAKSRVIYYGLGAVKGVGEAAAQEIVHERQKNGQFKDLFDFCQRIDLHKVNRRALESLAKSGALDDLAPKEAEKNRATIMASLDIATKLAEQQSTNRNVGQTDLFGFFENSSTAVQTKPFVIVADLSPEQKLRGEKESLGGYLSGHPTELYATELASFTKAPLARLKPNENTIWVGGWLIEVRTNKNSLGRITTLTLEDHTGQLEAVVYDDLALAKQEIFVKESLIFVEGVVREDKFNRNAILTANSIATLEQIRSMHIEQIILTISHAQASQELAENLLKLLEHHRVGHCIISVHYQRYDAEIELELGQNWRVKPEKSLLDQLKILLGEEAVKTVL